MRTNFLLAAALVVAFCGVFVFEADVAAGSVLHEIVPHTDPSPAIPDTNWLVPDGDDDPGDDDVDGRDFYFRVDPTMDAAIETVEVLFSMDHTNVGDLTVKLFSAHGTAVQLFADLPPGQNFENTRFADSSNILLGGAHTQAPYTSTYRIQGDVDPADGLAPFNSDPSAYNAGNRYWRLHVVDAWSGDTGELDPDGTRLFLTLAQSGSSSAIPEPATMLAVGLGLAAAGGYLRKRRTAK